MSYIRRPQIWLGPLIHNVLLTLYANFPGGSVDAIARHVSFSQITCNLHFWVFKTERTEGLSSTPSSPMHMIKWCNGHGSWVMGQERWSIFSFGHNSSHELLLLLHPTMAGGILRVSQATLHVSFVCLTMCPSGLTHVTAAFSVSDDRRHAADISLWLCDHRKSFNRGSQFSLVQVALTPALVWDLAFVWLYGRIRDCVMI